MMQLFLYALLAFAAGLSASKELNSNKLTISNTSEYKHYRLPRSIKPDSYELRIITDLEDPNNLTFVGEVSIYLRAIEDTPNITLHMQNLTLSYDDIELTGLKDNCVKSIEKNQPNDYLILNLCNPALRGEEYTLTIPFSGILNKDLRGYYRSSYVDKKTNAAKWLSVTQFEPAFARAAFPCFDEPDYKAKFTIILGHHKRYNALSNMPVLSRTEIAERADWVWTEFQQSVPMSTYLVAYTVNDFAHVSSKADLEGKVVFRTWARPDAIDQCHYAGIVGPQVLKYYEDIFHIKFPLEKIDQIAIPDFSAGAMENWGLVTYRETALLYAENVSSIANKQRVASVIAHELAHQWFGNLVTMKWWTDLWLNEGFATYVASLGVEHISPEWKSLDEESVDNTLTVFKLDSLKTSHPISQPISHTNKISEIFDTISYKKGSSVLRMMHLFLGDESFRYGIYNYLKRHAYSNAEQDNLWAALTESAHKFRSIPTTFDIKRIMDSWTLQTGYPIVTVKRNYSNKTAEVTQQRYLLDMKASRASVAQCWWVPLSFTTEKLLDFNRTEPQDWLACADHTNLPIPKTLEHVAESSQWFLLNVQMSGLYKVKYDEDNWNLIIEHLIGENYHDIHYINRAQLIDDALTLAWSGDQNYDVALRLMEYLKRETEYIPWKAALDNLGNINRILRPTSEYEHFKKYMSKILKPIYIHLGGLKDTNLKHKSTTKVLHKVLIAGWACRFEVEDCVSVAQANFKHWRSTIKPDEMNPIPTDLRSVIYCTVMRHGNEDDWNFLWERYNNSNVAAEKKTIITALGCSRESWLLQRYLSWAFNETSLIRKQDSTLAFGAVARGEVGYNLAKDFLFENIHAIYNYYEPSTQELARLIAPLASNMANRFDLKKITEFVEENKSLFEKAEESVKRALETIEINTEWRERHFDLISRRMSLLNL